LLNGFEDTVKLRYNILFISEHFEQILFMDLRIVTEISKLTHNRGIVYVCLFNLRNHPTDFDGIWRCGATLCCEANLILVRIGPVQPIRNGLL